MAVRPGIFLLVAPRETSSTVAKAKTPRRSLGLMSSSVSRSSFPNPRSAWGSHAEREALST